jgi:hypothetical protein
MTRSLYISQQSEVPTGGIRASSLIAHAHSIPPSNCHEPFTLFAILLTMILKHLRRKKAVVGGNYVCYLKHIPYIQNIQKRQANKHTEPPSPNSSSHFISLPKVSHPSSTPIPATLQDRATNLSKRMESPSPKNPYHTISLPKAA